MLSQTTKNYSIYFYLIHEVTLLMTNSSPESLSSKQFDSLDRDELLLTARGLLAEAQALSVRISAVNEIATAINRSLDLDEILRVVGGSSGFEGINV